MSILITGVSGRIGSQIAEYLINNNRSIIGCDIITPKNKINYDF